MRLNNKGFAISGILYSLLILFLILLLAILGVLASGKFSFDKMKEDVIANLTNKSKAFIYVGCDRYKVKSGTAFDIMTGVKFVNENGDVVTQSISSSSSPSYNTSSAAVGVYTITYSTTYQSVLLQNTRVIEVISGLSSNSICDTQ